MFPKSKIEIRTESDFREKVGLTEPVSLEWEEGRVVQATQDALDTLKSTMKGKEDTEKRKLALAFINENEKKEAEKDLGDQMEKVITSWVTDKLKKTGVVAWVVGGATALVHKIDHEVESSTGMKIGFKATVRNWLKEAMEENTFFLWGLWKILYHAFGGKSEGETVTQTDQKPQENISEKYQKKWLAWASKIFDKLIRGEKNPPNSILRSFLVTPQFLKYTPQELARMKEDYKNNPSGLAKKIGFPEKDGGNLLQTIELYFSPENQVFLKSVTAKSDNINNTSLAETYSKTLKYEQLLEKIREKKLEASMTEVSFKDGVSVTESVKEFVGDKKEMLEDLRERYAGFTPNVLRIIHNTYGSLSIEQLDFHTRESELSKWGLDGKQWEWEFVTKNLPEYAKSLPSLVRSFSFGNPDAQKVLEDHLRSPWLKQKDLIDFFVLSGGHTNFNEMNGYEKAQFTTRIMFMLRDEGSPKAKEAGYKYFYAMIGNVMNTESSIHMPPEVKNILRDTLWFFYKWIEVALEEVKAAALAFIWDHKLASLGVSAGVVSVILLAIKCIPVVRVVTGVWLILKLGIVSAAAFAWWKYLESEWVFQEDKTWKKVSVDDIAKNLPQTKQK